MYDQVVRVTQDVPTSLTLKYMTKRRNIDDRFNVGKNRGKTQLVSEKLPLKKQIFGFTSVNNTRSLLRAIKSINR